MIYLELFLSFLKVGCFSFGGAYGAIPLIRDVVLEQGWLTEEKLAYLIAVSESTPGPIMVNMATYVGSVQGGIAGALCATLGVVLPSFCMILLLITLLEKWLKKPALQAILRGLKASVVGIIMATGFQMVVQNLIVQNETVQPNYRNLVLTAVLVIILTGYKRLRKKRMSPVLLICCAAVLGVLIFR